MSASFPTSIKSWTPKTNDVDLVDAQHINQAFEEIIAIQTFLKSYFDWDGTNGARIGNIASGNFLQVDPGGTLIFKGTSTVWKDVDFPVIIKTTGSGVPTITTVSGGIQRPQWAVNDTLQLEGKEFPHEWKVGSDVNWHLHMITNGLEAVDKYVKWEIEWMFANKDGQCTTLTQSYEYKIPANTPDKTHILIPIYAWTPTGILLAAHVWPKLKRIASAGAAPAANPWLEMLQLHVECDMAGSHDITTK